MISMWRVISCVVERGCLLWPWHSPGRILLAITLLHFVLEGQACQLLQASLDFLLLHSNLLSWIGHLFLVLVLGSLLGLHRTDQLQLHWHWWLGHRLEFLWCWMICLENELRLFYCFWVYTQLLYFRLFCWLWGLLHFFYGILAHYIKRQKDMTLKDESPGWRVSNMLLGKSGGDNY